MMFGTREYVLHPVHEMFAGGCSCPNTSLAACYFVPGDATHWGCAALCGPDASLACVSSAAESELVARIVEEQIGGKRIFGWIGNYQSSDGGWNACSSGEAPGFTDWLRGHPSVDGPENCAIMLPVISSDAGGRWDALSCANIFPCICEHGVPTAPEYFARFALNLYIFLGIFLFVVLYKLIGHALIYSCRPEMLQDPLRPDLIVLCCVLIRERCSSTQLAPAAKLLNDSDVADALLAAERHATRLRARVNAVLLQVAWTLGAFGSLPTLFWIVGRSLTPTLGAFTWYISFLLWAIAFAVLILRPTDATMIAVVCGISFCVCILILFIFLYLASLFMRGDPIAFPWMLAMAALSLRCAALVAPTIFSLSATGCARSKMPPRCKLLRVWLVIRVLLFGFACLLGLGMPLTAIASFGDITNVLTIGTLFGIFPLTLLAAIVLTPRNRGTQGEPSNPRPVGHQCCPPPRVCSPPIWPSF